MLFTRGFLFTRNKLFSPHCYVYPNLELPEFVLKMQHQKLVTSKLFYLQRQLKILWVILYLGVHHRRPWFEPRSWQKWRVDDFRPENNNNNTIRPLLFEVLVQVSLVIRGRYVPLFWTANTEFTDKKKKTHFF